MRFKKTIFLSLIMLITFLIYLYFSNSGICYVALGDSLAAGQNPYGVTRGYGYSDYLSDYLMEIGKLDSYVKEYAESGYTTVDILEDLEINRVVEVNGHNINIRKALRESDLITISIGANDFMKYFSIADLNFDDLSYYKDKVDLVMTDIDSVLMEVRKYAKNRIVVVGYYNPFYSLFSSYEEELDLLFLYIDSSYNDLCSKYDVSYISIYELFKNNSDFLPNPFDIHPNLNGYKAISNLIINEYFS